MSASVAGPMAGTSTRRRSRRGWLRAYFWSDNVRAVQAVLGLIWCLDGGLQFQSFMYSHGFAQLLAGGASGQPGWLADSVNWGARLANGDLTVWNTLFALTQCLIGLGLLYRPTVKLTLAGSFLWVLIVWWFGEAFGMLFMDMAQPLTGAPGGVLIYGLIGLIVWPNGRPGGLLGIGGAKIMWCALWSVMAYLWLVSANSSANATSNALTATSSGMGWLTSLQNHLASDVRGDGLVIALMLGALTLAIAIGVAADFAPRTWLLISIALNIVYWVIPQGLGGLFAGGSTDPNAAPLFVLLAAAMFPLIGKRATGTVSAPADAATSSQVAA